VKADSDLDALTKHFYDEVQKPAEKRWIASLGDRSGRTIE